MYDFETYEHHGKEVSVRKDLRGKHREHCLCWKCDHFKPGQENNCKIAKEVFDNCKKYNLVTPVWECPKFKQDTLKESD